MTLTQGDMALQKKTGRHKMPIPQRWIAVVHMHLAGLKAGDIAEATGYQLSSISRILKHPDVNAIRQQMMEEVNQEFEALFPKVVDGIRRDLDDLDPKVNAVAREQWFKAHKRYGGTGTNIQVNVTAEDVVANILNMSDKDDQRTQSD